jgi:hypothetical protein
MPRGPTSTINKENRCFITLSKLRDLSVQVLRTTHFGLHQRTREESSGEWRPLNRGTGCKDQTKYGAVGTSRLKEHWLPWLTTRVTHHARQKEVAGYGLSSCYHAVSNFFYQSWDNASSCPRWSVSTTMFSMRSGLKRSAMVPAIQTTSWHGGSVLLLPSVLHSKGHIYPRHVPHDMTCIPKRGDRLLARHHIFSLIVTLFVILSEFQRFHNAIFHWYIIHGLADPNCILKRWPAYSTRLAIHRFVCYITK